VNLRRIARVSLDRLASISGLLAVSEFGMRGRLTVLTYHRVLPDALCRGYLFPSLAVPESMFRGQMATLARRCSVVTLEEGLGALMSGRFPERPMVAVTFDDGYADNVQLAVPIMDALGLRGTFFVVAGLIGTDGELWYDVAARRWSTASPAHLCAAVRACGIEPGWSDGKPPIEAWMALLKRMEPADRARAVDALPEPGPSDTRKHLDRLMTPDELRGMQATGHVIGSHTMSHPLLPQLDADALDNELVRSRELIEGWLQSPVRGFCYPNGDHDDRVIDAVKRAGYTSACTTRQGRNPVEADPFRLRRVDMHPSRSSGVIDQFDEPSFRASISLLHALHKAA
jgi:peptidoglycan/xylan/chitin deacetylase (PgdA/CDA1 family)